MEPWQDRLIIEAADLKTKCDKLSIMLNNTGPHEIDEHVRLLLTRQFGHMEDYLDVLRERIALFQNPVE